MILQHRTIKLATHFPSGFNFHNKITSNFLLTMPNFMAFLFPDRKKRKRIERNHKRFKNRFRSMNFAQNRVNLSRIMTISVKKKHLLYREFILTRKSFIQRAEKGISGEDNKSWYATKTTTKSPQSFEAIYVFAYRFCWHKKNEKNEREIAEIEERSTKKKKVQKNDSNGIGMQVKIDLSFAFRISHWKQKHKSLNLHIQFKSCKIYTKQMRWINKKINKNYGIRQCGMYQYNVVSFLNYANCKYLPI